MKALEFTDILYGEVSLPAFIDPFLRIPEFARLRGVRLSNLDSIEFKDFGGPSRWEHGIAVAALAWRVGERRDLPLRDRAHLALAGLLHDVATPPFAHSAEYVLPGFDHELETHRLLAASRSIDTDPDYAVFASELPRFAAECASLSRKLRVKIDPDEIARLVVGDGTDGWLIAGSLDLDNADNVMRACTYLGIEVDRRAPLKIADWLAQRTAIPTDLEAVDVRSVRHWLECRRKLYECFYEAGATELGRQAFLQHLMRRALREGFPRRRIVWNTDDGFLRDIESWPESRAAGASLSELVRRYWLLESPSLLFARQIETDEALRSLHLPQAVSWIEGHLTTDYFEPFALVIARRGTGGAVDTLLEPAAGTFLLFKLGADLKREQLPDWLSESMPPQMSGRRLMRAVAESLNARLEDWVVSRPWLDTSPERRSTTVSNLQAVGDWGFRLSRNDNFHAYPGTFVHAIPSALIHALDLRGELVLDPFGGTGQTAIEAIRYGGSGISADVSHVATLVSKVRLTYLPHEQRVDARAITAADLDSAEPVDPPDFPLRDKWHHPNTLAELCRISGFIRQRAAPEVRDFLAACFSATLTSTTGRWSKQHGFFADNTPLPAEMEAPPYRPATELFLARCTRALDSFEHYYAFIERDGRDPAVELHRGRACRLDIESAEPDEYGVPSEGAAAIITSPPYLCMADYALGNRLSYYWLFPEELDADFEAEIGARRKRFVPQRALDLYTQSIHRIAQLSYSLIRPGGFLAVVMGNPVAKAFSEEDLTAALKSAAVSAGFEPVWKRERKVHWHRNHGYARLRSEEISVFLRT